MQKIIINLGKYFCLMLGIFLFTSNVEVFGQVAAGDALIKEMRSFDYTTELLFSEDYLREMEELLENPNEVLDSWLMYWYKGDGVINFGKRYLKTREKWYRYTSKAENILNERVIEELSNVYTQPLEHYLSDLEIAEISEFDPSKFIHKKSYWTETDRELYNKVLQQKYHAGEGYKGKKIVYWIYDEDFEKLQASVKYFREKFDEMEERYLSVSHAQGVLLEQTYTPADIMKYAYTTGMLPKEKAGVKLTLKAMDNDVSRTALVRSIRAYLTEFGNTIKNVKYYPTASLMRELKDMTIAERIKYVDEITDLAPGSKNFIRDFGQLDRPAKRYVGKSITRGFWVLAALGAVATGAYITDVAANNNFNSAYTVSQRDLTTIGKKIKNGTASIQEKLAFFTNPSSEELVKTDPVYTLSFVELASDIYAADELLKTQETREQQTKDNINNTILNQLEKQMEKTDFGVGSL